MAIINKLSELVNNLQNEPLSLEQIKLLDPSSPLCAAPFSAMQSIKAQGLPIQSVIQGDGTVKYRIDVPVV